MTLNFPTSPNVNDTYTYNDTTFVWDGEKWDASTPILVNTANIVDDAVTGDKLADDIDIVTTSDVQTASLNGGPLAGLRNVLINGDFRVWQRGNTFNTAGNTLNAYTADRWYGNAASTNVTRESIVAGGVQQLPGFTNGIKADTGLNVRYGIELDSPATNSQFAKTSQWTLSYWSNQPFTAVNAGFTDGVGNLGAAVYFGNTALPTAIETNGGWTRYSKTITIDKDATLTNKCLTWLFVNTNSVSHTMTGVQFEPGPVATPFEHRPIATELALCQRYYFSNISGRPYQFGSGTASTTWMSASAALPQPMRATPSVVLYGEGGASSVGFLGVDGLNLVVASGTSFRLGNSASSTESIPVQAQSSTTSVYGFWFGLTADAEL